MHLVYIKSFILRISEKHILLFLPFFAEKEMEAQKSTCHAASEQQRQDLNKGSMAPEFPCYLWACPQGLLGSLCRNDVVMPQEPGSCYQAQD